MQSQWLYDVYKKGRHWDGHPTLYAKHFSDFLKNNSFVGTLVDVGCGSGRDVAFFCGYGLNAMGVDNSEQEIAQDKDKFPGLKFEVQDAQHLTFADGNVGAIFAINVIHYLDQKKALEEFSRILCPGGYVFIHFNLEIKDSGGNVDYSQDEDEIFALVSKFRILEKRIFERVDQMPKIHTHKILELILGK
ncbi:MAG: class I SAM-dependent methyltransferase [Candidatus Paceibacterota bacterium]|jgi:SAM-dependent methyltransferase